MIKVKDVPKKTSVNERLPEVKLQLGLGQSTVVSIGGDDLHTNFVRRFAGTPS
jgi:succinyl-CoA synthetase alpha subunit